MLLILASLACSDLIDLDFRGRVRSTSEERIWVRFDFDSFYNDLTYLNWGQFLKKILTKLCTLWFSR